MRFRREEEAEFTLGLAPLIDVVFLLLIFFTLTSSGALSSFSGIKINMPSSDKQSPVFSEDMLRIYLKENGRVLIEGKEIEISEIKGEIGRLSKERRNLKIALYADMDSRYGDVIRIMDMVRSAGVKILYMGLKRY